MLQITDNIMVVEVPEDAKYAQWHESPIEGTEILGLVRNGLPEFECDLTEEEQKEKTYLVNKQLSREYLNEIEFTRLMDLIRKGLGYLPINAESWSYFLQSKGCDLSKTWLVIQSINK